MGSATGALTPKSLGNYIFSQKNNGDVSTWPTPQIWLKRFGPKHYPVGDALH